MSHRIFWLIVFWPLAAGADEPSTAVNSGAVLELHEAVRLAVSKQPLLEAQSKASLASPGTAECNLICGSLDGIKVGPSLR